MPGISEVLVNRRKELALSLRAAAQLIGISHSYLDTLEKGKDSRTNAPLNPTPETLKLVSKAYDIDYEHLMKIAGYIENITGHSHYKECVITTAVGELIDIDIETIQKVAEIIEKNPEFFITMYRAATELTLEQRKALDTLIKGILGDNPNK